MKRLARAVFEALLTLWLLATLCFALLHAAPGGPFDSEKSAPPEVQAALAKQYRLDQSLPSQYAHWLGDIARGDLGPSLQYPDYRVSELIVLGLPVSAITGGLALIIALAFGIPLGLLAALHRARWIDRVLMGFSGLGLAVPKFVVAPLLVLLPDGQHSALQALDLLSREAQKEAREAETRQTTDALDLIAAQADNQKLDAWQKVFPDNPDIEVVPAAVVTENGQGVPAPR
jgi:ABC-type dipeptide/oligopeptide/nickel transport system permease component